MKKISEVLLELQPYINEPPLSNEQAHNQACSNDSVTIEKWRDQWISQIKSNHETYGPFCDRSVGKLHGVGVLPTIIAGSGPSLKENSHLLLERPLAFQVVSCLHNFHHFMDQSIKVDYWVTLDAGDITVKEVSEGGVKSEDEYWDLTRDQKLLAFIGTHPKLLEKWQGEIYFYNAPVPDDAYTKAVNEIETFNVYIESGGNVLGAATMLSKGVLGSQVSIFIGADFAFSDKPTPKFHAWDSSYDKEIGNVMRVPSIFGHYIKTWPSYYNFKLWFDVLSQRVPGIYINATEGGCFGAYLGGNLIHIKQMELKEAIQMFSIHDIKKDVCIDPKTDKKIVFI